MADLLYPGQFIRTYVVQSELSDSNPVPLGRCVLSIGHMLVVTWKKLLH